MVGYAKGKHCHADLHSSRIAQDEKDVVAMVDLSKNWTDPFAGHMQLFSLSNFFRRSQGPLPLRAPTKLERQPTLILRRPLLNHSPPMVKLHDKLKKQKLKTFSALS